MKILIKKIKSFTLMELLIASTILILILTAFLGTFNSLLNTAQQSKYISLALSRCLQKASEMQKRGFLESLFSGCSLGGSFDIYDEANNLIGKGNFTLKDRYDLYRVENATNTSAFPTGRERISCVVFDNKIWVIGGFDGTYLDDVCYSEDGVNWNCTYSLPSPRASHTSVVFNNKIWVIGGYDGTNYLKEVCYSSNGANWTCKDSLPSGRILHTSVVFNNKIWVIGGFDGNNYLDDVCYSEDGVNWNCTYSLPSPRALHTSVVFDNKIWVIAGFNGTGYSDDVIYSTDGSTWNTATTSATGIQRGCHVSLVYDGKMWILGGRDSFGTPFNDVWYSKNGNCWIKATDNANWSERYLHAGTVFRDRIWIIGGYGNGYKKDVWSSTGYGRLFEAKITAHFKLPNGRIIGEDKNLNGILDAGEDLNGNGELDSPVFLKSFVSRKKRGLYLGEQ